jgi:hypothetical protein
MIPPLGQWIDPRVFTLPIKSYRDYLVAHGWKLRPETEEGLVFDGPIDDFGNPIIMVLPTTNKAADFPLCADDFFRRLSILEERHPMEILQEMLRTVGATSHQGNGKNGTNGRKRTKARVIRRKTVIKK